MHCMLGIAPARGKCYKKHSMHFAPQNKEENPLLLQRQSHFAPQNKEDSYYEKKSTYHNLSRRFSSICIRRMRQQQHSRQCSCR